MSGQFGSRAPRLADLRSYRAGAVVGAVVMTVVYMSVLWRVIDVVGGSAGVVVFVVEVAAALGLAVALSRTLTVRQAVMLGAILLIGGLFGYLIIVPGATIALGRQLEDTVALVTGLSVLRMTRAGIWVLGFTPAPVFVSWYFVLRREYGLAGLVGGLTLVFFLSTGDLDTVAGLVGALGIVMLLGFGRFELTGGTPAQRNTLVTVLVAILVVTTSMSLVPGGQAQPLLPSSGTSTIEANLIDADEQFEVAGSISLSPEVRFTVTADEAAYWRVGAYDRYTGSGWVRTGTTQPYTSRLSDPVGNDPVRIRQTYEVESRTSVMPAAWKPVRVGVGADQTAVTSMGGLQPTRSLTEGTQYSVESFQNSPSVAALQQAGTDYPGPIRTRYGQLPESTPDRVGEFTSEITANADTPYETARVIEQWLEENKAYSLDVEQPSDNIAASFLFEMERGYCTYYATTMVTMLRTQGIPARLVVGYTPGQQVSNNQWVVRGLNSHAWVEVYFPEEGWIRFDPTPTGPREAAEAASVDQARANDLPEVDTNLSRQAEPASADIGLTELPNTNASVQREPTVTVTSAIEQDSAGSTPTPAGPFSGFGGNIPVPSREEALYGLILFVGAVTAAHRTGLLDRGYRSVWLRRQPSGPPRDQVEGAWHRVEYVLGRTHRPRRASETHREYLARLRQRRSVTGLGAAAFDERIEELAAIYERVHYGGTATEADARQARELLNDVLAERTRRWPWSGRIRIPDRVL